MSELKITVRKVQVGRMSGVDYPNDYAHIDGIAVSLAWGNDKSWSTIGLNNGLTYQEALQLRNALNKALEEV